MSFNTLETLRKVIPAVRDLEKKYPGKGYLILKKFENQFPKEIYNFIKNCLDNPKKDYKINIEYKKWD